MTPDHAREQQVDAVADAAAHALEPFLYLLVLRVLGTQLDLGALQVSLQLDPIAHQVAQPFVFGQLGDGQQVEAALTQFADLAQRVLHPSQLDVHVGQLGVVLLQLLPDLEMVMMGAKPLADQIADGTATVEGDLGILEQLASTMVVFDPRFEIMPGTRGPDTPEDLNDYEYGPMDLRGE